MCDISLTCCDLKWTSSVRWLSLARVVMATYFKDVQILKQMHVLNKLRGKMFVAWK